MEDNNLKQALLLAISFAKERHQLKALRPGYPQKLADVNDKLREPLYRLISFMATIQEANSDLEAFNLLTDRLTDREADWSDYAFNSYLIDALKAISRQSKSPIAPIDWNCFTPSAVKLFEGVVYRGTSSAPEKVFARGFVDYNASTDIAEYIKPRNVNVGVSTSRSFHLAESYTHAASRQQGRRFVYTVLYRGVGSVDIIETAKARGIKVNSLTNSQLTRALEKDEINIIERIASEHIYCATEFLPDGRQVTTYNPQFNAHFVSDNANFAAETLKRTFIQKLYEFFANVISFFKVFKWVLMNQEKVKLYGQDYRKQEIQGNPLMQEAEDLYVRINDSKNSYDLVTAHLQATKGTYSIIDPEPADAAQIDSSLLPQKKSAQSLNPTLELNETAFKLSEEVDLEFTAKSPSAFS